MILDRLRRSPRLLRALLNLYPPFVGAGIRTLSVSPDVRRIRVAMGLHWFNRNLVGTQFGGSLFAMTDPFLMLMLMRNLGRDYVVWDRAAKIDFLRPGRGRVEAEFVVTDDDLSEIRERTAGGEPYHREFTVEVRDAATGKSVARVHKTLYVRRQDRG